jgi:ATP-dependent RNA helicase DDX56/DBP9
MKRKLDEDDVPTPVVAQPTSENSTKGFEGLGLDTRLLQAIAQAGFKNPTAVQAQAIPLALEGKDILARSKTGSGKTAAYILPILQRILREKATNPKLEAVSALILVPTRELANQVSKAFTSFAAYCAKDIVTINLTQKVPDEVQRSMLADLPDVVVATPARTLLNLSASALSLEFLKSLVIDEADLVLSYGYEEDLQAVAKAVPSGVQTYLMSATLSTEVDTLKGLFCRDPVVLALDEAEEGSTGVQQYVVKYVNLDAPHRTIHS